MFATAGETRDGAANFSDPREIAVAVRTFVKKTSRPLDEREWQIVATLFVADSEIDTGHAPFFAMRENATSTGSKLRKKVRQLVAKCTIDLLGMIVQLRIERD